MVAETAPALRPMLLESRHIANKRLGGFLRRFSALVLGDGFSGVHQSLLRVRVDQQRIKTVDGFAAEADGLTRAGVERHPAITMIAGWILGSRDCEEWGIEIDWRSFSFLRRIEVKDLRRKLLRVRIFELHAQRAERKSNTNG